MEWLPSTIQLMDNEGSARVKTDSISSVLNFRSTDHLLFLVQVLVILIVVITSIVNLTIENGNLNLWTALLSSCLGYILPNPKIKLEKTIKGNVPLDLNLEQK